MIIDIISFFALDIANKYNIPYIVVCPIDPSNFFMSKLPWSYPSSFKRYNATFLDIIKHKIEINIYMIYNIIFKKLGNTRIKLTGNFNTPEKLIRNSNAIIYSNIWGPMEPFDHPYNLYIVGSIIEENDYIDDLDLINWIDKDVKNVILVSFGSIATLSSKIIKNLQIAFENITNQYKLKILWKLKNNDIESTNNIKIINWIPSMKQIIKI